MERIKSLFGILTITSGLVVCGYSQTFLTNGLVAYFPFNGNANDASGNNVSTSLTGNYGFTTNQGRPCLSLNTGLTPPTLPQPVGMISVTRPAALNPTADITISTWLNIDRYTSGAFPSDGASEWSIGPHTHAIISFGDDGFAGYNIFLKTATNQVPDLLTVSGGDFTYSVRAKLPPFVSQWVHLVTTKTAGNFVTVYWNGVVMTNGTLAGVQNPSQAMLIGRHTVPPPFDYPMIGSLSSYRVYNRVLSASEVQQVYAHELGPVIALIKAVKPSFSNLTLTTNYQLQVSADMSTWTNQGSAFTATKTSMVYPQYWDVDNWNKLFFRLQVAP